MENKKSLDMLVVLDCLEVCNLEIQPDRVKAKYIITKGKKKDYNYLIYRYEERVFNTRDSFSLNLASMIAAQVALNYGLFCKRIVFHGLYDNYDKQFIKEMMENTAREIYIKKFMEENVFLTDEYKNIPVTKLDSYLQAELVFTDTHKKYNSLCNEQETENDSYAVLSSGGKDSLLSFGLLSELSNNKTYPLFINESGRHWFTALNAYRYFKKNVKNTMRVWTNSDRIFSWMLQHFPFIKKDYFTIRSDEYPIRLWTVAVFLFAALPCLRKRKIHRLIIGNEYDTSVRLHYKNISHYNGLYDQSRFFDNRLSLYFKKKKWSIIQFSILRFLSELLIIKILTERYPDLQENQISCHAAHIKNDRVYPCGKCEKCRRIVAILVALEKDPCKCGYNKEQIDYCLESMRDKPLHQEIEAAEHLYYLLNKKDIIPEDTITNAKPHPEVMKIRVDKTYSPVEDIPVDLRQPLFNILSKYTDGSVSKKNSNWKDINILDSKYISSLYRFNSFYKN